MKVRFARLRGRVAGLSAHIVTFAVPAILLFVALIQGSTLVWRLFAVSVLILLLSYLWLNRARKDLTGKLKNHGQRYEAGHPIDVESVIENNGILPKPFVKLHVATPLSVTNNGAVLNMSGRGSYYWHCQVLQPRRGRYELGPLMAELSDPFGLLRVRKKLADEQEVLVYPRTVDLSSFWLAATASSGIGENSWFNRGTGNTIFGIREYVPGDSLNRIHWRSTAHTGKLVVKEFDTDLAKKIWVLLDLERQSNAGKDDESTEEYAVTIAASILKKYADSGCQVGLAAYTDGYHFHQARGGLPHLWRLFECLAVLKATGRLPLHKLIDRVQPAFDGNSIAAVITPAVSSLAIDAVARVQTKGVPVVVVSLNAGSFGGNKLATLGAVSRLHGMGIPVYTVKKGDNLSEVLNSQGKHLSLKSEEGVG